MEGSLKATADLIPIRFNAMLIPIETVVLPSPAGVGVIADTRTSLPSFLSLSSLNMFKPILALFAPYVSRYLSGIPAVSAISAIGFNFAFLVSY